VNRRKGISIKVGKAGSSAAHYRVGSVSEICDWLDGALLRRLEGRSDLLRHSYRKG
jgi:hypothetical protein